MLGIDIDLVFELLISINQINRDNYSLLVEELKSAFADKGWLLTAAVPAPPFRVDDGYDVLR